MRKIKFALLYTATVCLFLNCKKSEDDNSEACADNNTTKVTFINTTSASLRIVVSSTLTPQLEPVNPIVSIDLAAGQSMVKEFQAGRYANTWYNGCPSTCNRRTYSFKPLINVWYTKKSSEPKESCLR